MIALMMAIGVYPVPHEVAELGGSFDSNEVVVYSVQDAALEAEEYRLTATNGVVEIASSDDRGAFYARQTLDQLRSRSTIPNVIIKDRPDIALRGVVEGYYGRPWGTEGRLELMDFMGKYKLNTFVYGPKDDPYHHVLWRDPYPEKEAEDFRKLLAAANKNKINFYWAIHLGGGFRKGGEEEREDFKFLLAKLEQMYNLGVRSFGVFFDDFGEADVEFHVKIANFMAKYLHAKKLDTALLVCPNVYWGCGETDYVKAMGEKLDKKAMIIWTGRCVCSDILAADTAKVSESYRRAPFVWWNWPVNDYCRSKVLMGRTYGIEPAEFSGFVTNPMENCEANKVAIFGVADWCWNQQAFDSQKNWDDSFGRIYDDKEVAKAMRIFAAHNSDPDKSAQGFRREESEGKWDFGEIAEAMDTLKQKLPMGEPKLWWELEGWIVDLECTAKIGLKLKEYATVDGEMAKRHIIQDIMQLRAIQEESAKKHMEKFMAATFENDAKLVVAPRSGTKALKPAIEQMMP